MNCITITARLTRIFSFAQPYDTPRMQRGMRKELLVTPIFIFFLAMKVESQPPLIWAHLSNKITVNLNSVAASSTKGLEVYCVGDSGFILKYGSAPSITGTTSNLYSVNFDSASPNIGYVVGANGTFLKTLNGGSTWTVRSEKLSSGALLSVDFVHADTGWISGEGGMILKSTDGGMNWVQQISGTALALHSVNFHDNLNGYAVGDRGTILITNNGGNSWTPVASGTLANLYGVNSHLPSDNHYLAYAVGDSGIILRDSQNVWTRQVSPFFKGKLTSIDILNSPGQSFAMAAAGDSGIVIYGSNLGGWTRANILDSVQNNQVIALSSIRLTGPYSGYAVGPKGVILAGYFDVDIKSGQKSDPLFFRNQNGNLFYGLSRPDFVSTRFFDLRGRMPLKPFAGKFSPGEHSVIIPIEK